MYLSLEYKRIAILLQYIITILASYFLFYGVLAPSLAALGVPPGVTPPQVNTTVLIPSIDVREQTYTVYRGWQDANE